MGAKESVSKAAYLRTLPVNDLFQVDFWIGDFFITKDRRLVGALELDGYDADSLGQNEHFSMARLADSIYSNVPAEITVTQYYINYTGATVSLKKRDNEFSNTLSKSRVDYLNNQKLTAGRLYQFFEISLDDDLNDLSVRSLFNNVVGAFSSSAKRKALKAKLSIKDSVLLHKKDIEDKKLMLSEVLSDVLSRWSMFFEGHTLSREHVTRVLSYLASFRSETLVQRLQVPDMDSGSYLADGDITPVSLKGVSALKFSGESSKYLRIASVTSLGKQPVPGLWFLGEHALGNQIGNFIIMYRFKRLSNFEKGLMFETKENELARDNLNLLQLTLGRETSYEEKQARMSKKHKDMFKELDEAKAHDVGWSNAQCMIATFSEDPEVVRENSRMITNALENTGFKFVWESVGIGDAYKVMYPTGANYKFRRLKTNTRQNAVASLYFKPQEGQRFVEDLQDESQFILQTPSGRPFYFSPYVGGRGLLIGIGPTRSGKTYFKNTLASHFLKYGGDLVDIDIDPGSEIVAKTLGKDGAIFNVGKDSDYDAGFNLLSTASSVNDNQFNAHLTQQLLRMLKANDEPSMQTLSDGEQKDLDNAISATLNLDRKFHTLSYLVAHMKPTLKSKFNRWVRKGREGQPDGKYAYFSDCVEDAAGGLSARHKVFNFQNIKSDPHLLSIAYPEVFYRIIKSFEDPERRNIPKGLQIDECHHPLKDPWFADMLVTGAVTWNKYLVMLQLWTQSPSQLQGIDKWDAIRTSAATFVFMADPAMDEDIYKKVFDLSDGEVAAIRTLKPRSEAYIIQRDINISRKVILNNDPVMHATATSHPKEVPIREKYIKQYGLSEGLKIAAQEIQSMGIDTTKDDSATIESKEKLTNFYN